MDLTDKTQLLIYLKQHGLWAKKGLSQNFLVDKNVLEKILEAAEIKPDDLVIEIGPGVGTLTQELIKRAGEVIAVELDQNMASLLHGFIANTLPVRFNSGQDSGLSLPHLTSPYKGEEPRRGTNNETVKQGNSGKLKVNNADILKLNLNEIVGEKKYKVVANIPYHITSKILELFLSRENKPEMMVLLVQKEVAERVCAKPAVRGSGRGDMSILSVSVQLYGEPEIIDIVPKESFFPSPKVDSAILKIVDIHNPSRHFERSEESSSNAELDPSPRLGGAQDDKKKNDEKKFFRLIHISFAARRKTLLNNLMAGYRFPREKVIDILKEAGLKDTVRAQELSIEQWKKLSKIIINC